MSNSEQIGLAITAIIAILGAFKLELIKGIVSNITSGKGNVSFLSIGLLIIISIVPAFFGFYFSESSPSLEDNKVEQASSNKSDLEVGLEIGQAVLSTSKELLEERKANKEKRDSIFLANRPHRWAFRIGDIMDNDEAVEKLYHQLKNNDSICLFKTKNDFFLFRKTDGTKEQLDISLDSLQSEIGYSATVVGLMTYCTNKKEEIKRTKDYRLGRKKDRVEIECYIVDK